MNKKKILAAKNKICLALDVDDAQRAVNLAKLLKKHVGLFKIGSELYTTVGPDIVETLVGLGTPVFLDLKFHDIPNTVNRVVRVVTRLGVSMFNVHAAGGAEMIRAAVDAAQDEAAIQGVRPPLVLAVTVLTSIDKKILQKELLIDKSIESFVRHLATMAKKHGADGVVASPKEVRIIRETCGEKFRIVTPGVRPQGSFVGDQKRIATPSDAIKQGSNYVVIGRPILTADDPVDAAQKIAKEIAGVI